MEKNHVKQIFESAHEIKRILHQNGFTADIIQNDDGENINETADINILPYNGNESLIDNQNREDNKPEEYKYNTIFFVPCNIISLLFIK